MKPFTIGITGSKSGVGKTALAERLLRRLPGWGAIKFTKSDIYTSVVDEADVLREEGKDTARLLAAGADRVVWVKSPGPLGDKDEELAEAMMLAMDRLSGLPGVIIEGNSAVEVLKPDIVIFIGVYNSKDSARRAFEMADVVLGAKEDAEGPARLPHGENAVFFYDAESCAEHVLRLVNERGGDKS
jgi:molybdopterin-guanine dinucleotide biosynthesis protein